MFPCDETEEETDEMMMEDKSMMMEDIPSKITENKYEHCPKGLKLTVTTGQFIKMWKDGYFGTGYRGQDKKMVPGGYIITFTKEEEVKFMENISEISNKLLQINYYSSILQLLKLNSNSKEKFIKSSFYHFRNIVQVFQAGRKDVPL